jgi:hypothetical protein
MSAQLQIFRPSRDLGEVPLEQRVEAARQLILNDPAMTITERQELLLCAVCPAAWKAES